MRKSLARILIATALGSLPLAALAQTRDAGHALTVNQFTTDEATRALKAASDAGYKFPVISWYQGGNFFIIGAKEGGLHRLTVTPKGEFFAGPAGQYALPQTPVRPADTGLQPSS
jgi:hypothetical protein